MFSGLFSSSQRAKEKDVRRLMGRLINNTCNYDAEYKEAEYRQARSESRCERQIPVLLAPVEVQSETDTPVIIGVTRDICCLGLSVITQERIPECQSLVVIGDHASRIALQGQTRHCRHLGYGLYQSGIQLLEVLNQHSAATLIEYVDTLEEQHELASRE